MKIQHLILAIAMFIIACPLFAGPFGLEMGMQPNDPVLKNLEEKRPGVYFTKTVPKPHTAFEEYYLYFDPNYGLAKIKAFSPPIPSVKVQQKLSQLYDELKQNYGWESYTIVVAGSQPIHAVELPPEFSEGRGSEGRGPNWIDKLFEKLGIQGDVFHKRSWLKEQKNNIVTINLERAAFNQDSDVVVLEYHFSNYRTFPPDGLDKLDKLPEKNGSVL